VAFIDEDFQTYSEIWAAAGTPRTVFRMTPKDLVELIGGRVTKIAGEIIFGDVV
jgi:prolyl-tRNA editing enzyme YbaK/EbsC (Cys-tRNA(Pro) deacylase)